MLEALIRGKKAKVAVIGLGYVGLPTAVEIAKNGYQVFGIDLEHERIKNIQKGISYILDTANEELKSVVDSKNLKVSTKFDALKSADIALICVPTPLDEHKIPDVSYINSAVDEIAPRLHKGQLIILESSTYPGTTREIILPRLERKGFKVGKDFFLAFSPERVDPGNDHFKFKNIARVVGGITAQCTKLGTAFYKSFVQAQVTPVSSAETAEMTKILENTFRLVNISMINELALLAGKMGIDIWEVIEAAKTKPYGFMPFYPSPKVGGHCFSERQCVFVKRKSSDKTELFTMKDLFFQYAVEQSYRSIVCPVAVSVGANRQLLNERGGHMNLSFLDDASLKPVASGDLQVLSFNLQSGKAEFQDVEFLSKRRETTTLQIQTAYGHTLEVTENHPVVIAKDKDGFAVKKSQDVQKGDWLALSRRIPNIMRSHSLDLIDLIMRHPALRTEHIRVRPATVSFKLYRSILDPFLKDNPNRYSFYDYNTLPLHLYCQIEGQLRIPRKELFLCRGHGSSYSQIPAAIAIDKDFARLVGYYLSEGCITKESKTSRIRFTFHEKEREYVNDVTGILQRKGIAYSVWKDPNWKNIHIKISSAILGALFGEELFCGRNCYEMRIPDQIFYSSRALRQEALKGLMRGDGGVNWKDQKHSYVKKAKRYTHNSNSVDVCYFTSSPMLFEQVQLLLLEIGVVPQIQKRAGLLRIMGSKNMRKLEGIFLGEKQEKIEWYLKSVRKEINYRFTKLRKSMIALKVTDIRPISSQEVYSLEVANTNTLLTNTGIIAHNCIPLDPFYLSWKARQYGFWARFIELAGEINEQMPHYVVTRLIWALNLKKKSLRGANILVWGVAYKKNIADPRESAAYEIIPSLQRKGAKVDYFDSFIPEFKIGEGTMKSITYSAGAMKKYDAVLILTDHAFDYDRLAKDAKMVVDTRNAIKSRKYQNVFPW